MQVSVVIDNTKVTADLTDFVVYIDLSDMPAAFWNTVTNGGGDIRCYKSDGTTELAREVVRCDTSVDQGELHIKFSGTLSSSVDTEILIDVDGVRTEPAVTATYGRNAVWSDYSFVYHLNEAVNTTSGGYVDSTGNGYDATGVSMAITETTGKLAGGNGQNFDGTADLITIPNAALADADGQFIVSAWWKGTDAGGFIVSGYESSSPFDGWNMGVGIITAGKVSCFTNSAGWLTGATAINNDVFHHVVTRRDGTNWSIYIDGASDATPLAGSYTNSNENGAIGARQGASNYLAGLIDEVRKAKTDKGANWISTEYNNQNSPSTFYTATAGDITVTPSAQVVTASIPAYSVKTGLSVAPAAQSATFSVPAYTVSLPKVVTPAAQTATFSIPTYVIDAGGNITVAVATQTITASIPAYSVLYDKVVSANALVATFSTPASTISGGTGVTITPAAQVATLSIPTYTVATAFSLVISAAAQVLTFSIPTLAKVGGVWTKVARATSATWSRRSVNDD